MIGGNFDLGPFSTIINSLPKLVHISEWGNLKPTLARENVQSLGTVAFIEKIKEWVVESASELV